ncbi:ABC transporter permease [Paenibacillus pini]|uniref:Bacitracin transport permease protein BCRB n=1 Tax=Paenibacillus pini JCM 16418 TaxID=1236976 RepID=W7YUA5_9BACL|nr:ABC transporter permease [Paenibacillus pini]GAF08156.1 bacitracin transport permease protein BCRB [Paenibacillus pini JCM 16418]
MLKLIKLEMKKNKFGWYWKGAAIANIVILLFIWLIAFTQESEDVAFSNFEELYSTIGIFVRATFAIFASVLISRLIIDEYKNKTMTVLFTYPISRKKLMIAKLILIIGMTLVSILVSMLFVSTTFTILNAYFQFIPGSPNADLLFNQGFHLLIVAISTAGLSLIPLYFGMRKKSVSATIVSSVLIISVISSSNKDFSLGSFLSVSISLGILGLFIAYLSFRNVDRTDIV